MFSSSLKRLPLRRCLHTQIPQHTAKNRVLSSRHGIAVGASVVVASYITWRLTHGQRIALDSATTLDSSNNTPALDGPSSETPKPTPTKKRTPSRSDTSENVTPDSEKVKDAFIVVEGEKSEGTLALDGPSAKTSKPTPTKKRTPTRSNTSENVTPNSEKEKDASIVVEGETSEGTAEAEATSEAGAYNPVTGEINWDCPCLGGMAYGPCGQEFREAFSCFVFSEEEPKGINCVEKFQAMQTCFRQHPEHYADEIMDDDEEPSNSSPDSSEAKVDTPKPPTEVPLPESSASSDSSAAQSQQS